ncbi:FliH/SctL family protein [Aliarcobacter butzleri]|jgi:flagellar assembly protein FliH|uniref:Flagellar assembly protein FliH n=3 Tax=Aliarcobacter butzleri TaxID=28197 RepID=A0AAP4PD25_9BACT|nr:FliH/SctL family protein [Aliarcobacter butzleri]EFU70084.1 flagellar assembly protein FliH [Aliarcobacter butzleri JV22]KLE08263.1 flagellar assembly protein FliH [Aliarcobacter butzleri L355]MCG3675229.1 flagellar assembly protein FliH [Aliarcobacter butzleri]MCG3679496.1 flagellar assembly protein FliH [Aliarcobacter butzleri]MCG3698060.1 flagellar assembly protein FliH [Aliarcobacter butzleri]
MAENVYSTAKIVSKKDDVEKYELVSFIKNDPEPETVIIDEELGQDIVDNKDSKESRVKEEEKRVVVNEIIGKIDPILQEVQNLTIKLNEISQKVTNIEQEGVTKGKDLDAQVVKAIKDLKQYAAFFEQATFQMETKLLKTSISIAQKIINIEVGENSSKIAKQTINQLLEKVKSASKVKIHLNPKDYHILKAELSLEPFIELCEDPNVIAGGVVIASDLGNFDGSVEAKVTSMLESLDLVI